MAQGVIAALAASERELVVLAKPAAWLRSSPSFRASPPTLEPTRRRSPDRRLDPRRGLRRGGGAPQLVSLRLARPGAPASRVATATAATCAGGLLAPATRRPPAAPRRPQIADYAELLAAMGVAAPASWIPRLEPGPDLRGLRGRERLARGAPRTRLGPARRPLPGRRVRPEQALALAAFRRAGDRAAPARPRASAASSSPARRRSGPPCGCTRRAAESTR